MTDAERRYYEVQKQRVRFFIFGSRGLMSSEKSGRRGWAF